MSSAATSVATSRATHGGIFLALALAGAALALPQAAYAGPHDIYGVAGRSAAMGGAQTAMARGPSALSYNLAGMAKSPEQWTVGAFASFGQTQVLLMDRPGGYDVPELGGGLTAMPSARTRRARADYEGPAPLYALSLGGIVGLGLEGLVGGAHVTLPTNDLLQLNTHYADERERYYSNQLRFEFLGERVHRLNIEVGLAHRLTERLSVGVGGTYLPGAMVLAQAWVPDPTDQGRVDLNARVRTTNAWGLLMGAELALPGEIDLGATYRGAVAFRIAGANDLQVQGIDDGGKAVEQAIDWVPHYSPASFGVGLSRPFGSWRLAYDARYWRWSDYRDTHNRRPGFEDRISHHLGLELAHAPELNLMAGLGYLPSPVPEQTERTNYVDNTRLTGSVGASHQISVGGRPLQAAWSVQVHYLVPRLHKKRVRDAWPACTDNENRLCDEVPDELVDPQTGQPYPEAAGLQTENPGFPGFSSGGWLGSLGVEFAF